MIQVGIWTGQRWTARGGNGPDVLVDEIHFERGEVIYEYLTHNRAHPKDIIDLTSFTQRFRLVRND